METTTLQKTVSAVVAAGTVVIAIKFIADIGSSSVYQFGSPVAGSDGVLLAASLATLSVAGAALGLRQPRVAPVVLLPVAAFVSLWVAVLMGRVNGVEYVSDGAFRHWIFESILLLAAPGFFWLIAGRWLAWPAVFPAPFGWVRAAAIAAAISLITVLGIGVQAVRNPWLWTIECHSYPQPSVVD